MSTPGTADGGELDPRTIAEMVEAISGVEVPVEDAPSDRTGEAVDDEEDFLEEGETCEHPWPYLTVDVQQKLMACGACSTVWDTDDADEALLALWSSTTDALRQLYNRLDGLEQVVSERLDVRPCARCGEFFDLDDEMSGLEIAGTWSCRDHVPLVTAMHRVHHPEIVGTVAMWAETTELTSSSDLGTVRLYEQLVSASPQVAEAGGSGDGMALSRLVRLRPALAGRLGCSSVETVAAIAAAMAALIDVPAPTGRAGAGWLLALVASGDEVLAEGDLTGEIDPGELWAVMHHRALPVTAEARRRVAADLVDDPQHLFTEDLLKMMGVRAVETLMAPLMTADGPTD